MTKVYLAKWDKNIAEMYYANGWDIVSRVEEADLAQFVGGADVSPEMYGEDIHPSTRFDVGRDKEDLEVYAIAQVLGIPCVGICRGGQFLNVVNGGSMYQDVDKHAIGGTHPVYDVETGVEIHCTSTHHQQIRPSEDGTVIAHAGHRSTYRDYMVDDKVMKGDMDKEDVEVVHYPSSKSLCFQPHPEYVKPGHECQDYYFNLIFSLLGLSSEKEEE